MFLFHETCPHVLCLIEMSHMNDVAFPSELLPLHFLLHFWSSLARYVAVAWGWQPHHLHVPNIMKSGSLNLLEPSGQHRACYGTPLPLSLLARCVHLCRLNINTICKFRFNTKNFAFYLQILFVFGTILWINSTYFLMKP